MKQTVRSDRHSCDPRRGAALAVSLVLMTALAGVTITLTQAGITRNRELRVAENQLAVSFACEGALTRAYANVVANGSGVLASEQAPQDWDGIECWVEQTVVSPTLRTLTSTAVHPQARRRLCMVMEGETDSFFKWAVFGDVDLHADANAQIDSYDSDAGSYASQAVNGSGADQHAGSEGNMGSNQDISIDQNVKIWGALTPGPESSATVLGNAQVAGTTAPMENTVDFPPLLIPSYTSLGALTVNGTVTKAAGTYQWTSVLIKPTAKLVIAGPSTIVMSSLTMKSGSTFEVDDTNGPVTVYIVDDLIMNSNTTVKPTSLDPKSLSFKLNGNTIVDPDVAVDLDDIDFDSNSKFYGTIYAPNADIEIDSNFELFGSLMAHSVDLDSNCKIHYDASLGLLDSDGIYDWGKVCVFELAAQD
jgi:hypothetical protein